MKKLAIILIAVLTTFASCKKSTPFDPVKQAADDDAAIQAYIKANNIPAIKDPSGLYYQIVTEGTGANASATSTITVNYIGKFTDGSVFDSGNISRKPLSGLIQGWIIGLPYCKVGGRILLLIPSGLGYGHNPSNGFKSDAVTIFTIDLTAIQ